MFIFESMVLTETIGTPEFVQWQVMGRKVVRHHTKILQKLRIRSTMATFFKIPELQIYRLFNVLQKTHTVTNNNREICIYYCQFVILSYTPKYSIVINIITRHQKVFIVL